MSRRTKTGSLLLLACAVAGAAAIHRATHGIWFGRRAASWPAHADTRAAGWTALNPIPIGSSIKGVWGKRPDDVWAWSRSGIMHWDGRTWARVPRPPRAIGDVDAIGGSIAGTWLRDVRWHAGSGSGCLVTSDYAETNYWCRIGNEWKLGGCVGRPGSPSTTPGPPPDLTAHSEGTFVTREELARLWSAHTHVGLPSLRLERGYRVGGGELWAVDRDDRWLVRFDGSRWTGAANTFSRASSMWFASEDDGWAVEGDVLYRWDGREWKRAAGAREALQSVWGAAPDDVWAVGAFGLVMHFDGRAWSEDRLPLPRDAHLTRVAGRARDDVWITGCDATGFTAHWNGVYWLQESIAPSGGLADQEHKACPLLAPEGGGRALAAVGDRMFEFRAGRWRERTSPLASRDGAVVAKRYLNALVGGARGDIWAVGTQFRGRDEPALLLLLRRAGGDWTQSSGSVESGQVYGVWARGADDVWAVGSNGLIRHFDGRSWTQVASGTDETLVGIHGAGRTIWVVGGEGGLFVRRM